MLGTINGTPTETLKFMLDLPSMQIRLILSVASQSILQWREKFPQLTQRSRERLKNMPNGTEQVLGGSSTWLNNALMPAERYPTRFRNLYINVRKLGKSLSTIASRQNGVRDQASCSNNGPQALTVYTDSSVNKDKPGLGFTVKQRTATIHEENAANTVSTSSLMIVETVTMSFNVLPPEMSVRPHMPSSSQIYWACNKKVKRGMGSPHWDVSNARNAPSKTPVDVLR